MIIRIIVNLFFFPCWFEVRFQIPCRIKDEGKDTYNRYLKLGTMYTGKRILIVDDDQDIILSFKVTLEDYGFKVDTRNDALLALSQFKPRFYDLLLIDIRMPNMSGFELSEKIREADPDVKICFITAFDIYYESLLEEYPNMDFNCFIKKPISTQALLERIELELSSA